MNEFSFSENIEKDSIIRVNTGLSKLDDLLSGGIPQNSITLVSGTPGSGKTILCFHYIAEGIKNSENCLYLTSDERIKSIVNQAYEVGFNFEQAISSGLLKFMYIDLDKRSIHKEIEIEINQGNYCRIVLDSLTPVAESPVWISDGHEFIPSEGGTMTRGAPEGSIPAIRTHVRRILTLLTKENCTAMVTSEIPEGSRSLSRDSISEFLVDGILLMDLDMTIDRRKIIVRKMRGTNHTLKPHNIAITEGGIKFV